MAILDEPITWTDEEYQAVVDAIRAKHEQWAKENPRHVAMRAFCICGYSSTATSDDAPKGCRALRKLMQGKTE